MKDIETLHSSNLMKLILVERFNDLDKLKVLCNQLLAISNEYQDTYGIAFANVYLFDSFSSLRQHEEARFYLLRAQSLCEQYLYEDLYMVLHNLAGLYYQDLFDEHSALQHYIQGLELAQKLHDSILESKIYNNLGICFRRRYDNETALYYFSAAYETIKDYISDEVRSTTISFLCNISEINLEMNRCEESNQVLQKAQALYTDSQYSYFQLKSAWCAHYAVCGDKEKSIAIARKLIDDGLCNLNYVHVVSSAYFELFDHMMKIDCQELAYQYLMLIEASCSSKTIGDYYNYIRRKIKYYESYGTSEACESVYKEFYGTSLKLNEVDDALRVEHILSKVDLSKELFELKTMRKENKQLENASHIDKLTDLYNRRYMSKLQSKVWAGTDHVQLGYVMLDIDYFKEYNDFYGHFKGDDALVSVADILKLNSAERIYASRYGGDEFLVLFVNHTNQSIINYIGTIQAELKKRCIPHEKSHATTYLTLSIGFSNGYVNDEDMLAHLLHCADQALYQAKEDGRDCFRYQAI